MSNLSREDGTSPMGHALRALLDGYQPVAGVADELFGADGKMRPVWHELIGSLARMGSDDLSGRMDRANAYLRDSGVFYRQYDDSQSYERDWPLSHVPVVLDAVEWQSIATGLSERADLLERILADIYGDNTLVRDGHLPAELVARNPEWLRPLVGAKPRSGHFLHLVAFDIGRGPKGAWWVLGDRTQAPSGIGFSLENRMATKRAFPEAYNQSHIIQLSQFFGDFRNALEGLKATPNSQVGVLSPGRFNETYLEHAYIARYLGLSLLGGEDLVVRDGRVMVRTISGLEPIDVLWRRLDGIWADPLELEETSFLGVAGLVGAIRDQGVTMVNALGSGILETRAMLAFIPKIAEVLNGKPLSMPNIATWWTGQDGPSEEVKANAENLIIGDAFSTRLPFDLESGSENYVDDVPWGYRTVEHWIDGQGADLVAQEAVTISTTPALIEGRLVPRPMNLRVYLARTPQGWSVMPGGFARIGKSSDFTKLALQQGGSVADVWVAGQVPRAPASLLVRPEWGQGQDAPSVLPSRAADNLFWLGRYIERAENGFRVLRAYHSRLGEAAFRPTPLLLQLAEFMDGMGLDADIPLSAGLRQTLSAAQNSAGQVRDRFSTDGWLALNDLAKSVNQFALRVKPGEDAAQAMGVLLRKISGFNGLVHENMYKSAGWRFLSIGLSLERAIFVTDMLLAFTEEPSEEALGLALDACDSTISHRRRFGARIEIETVNHFLGLDPLNPRSVLQQLNDVNAHVGFLPKPEGVELSELQKRVLSLQTELAVQSPEGMDTTRWAEVRNRLYGISERLTRTYMV